MAVLARTFLSRRKSTMWCHQCDVTWWGTARDTCWACRRRTATTPAPTAQVRVLATSAPGES
ncbi:hypothetical protein [Candidatus Poriferisocius sp.]|uniref:hypothetical protein n=1 Tax=Candidatus Poriferisocius sp. TaxID=3101276 RepID=UPI003B02EC0C